MLRLRADSRVVSTSAAAPSLMPEALPAVTIPVGRNEGLSLASASTVLSARVCSSFSMRLGPFLVGISTATISSDNRSAAAAARRWLSTANSSASSRVTWYFAARFSAVMAIGQPQ